MLSSFFQFVIFIFGWKLCTPFELDYFNDINGILIFPHTSFFDFFIMLLYRFAYPEIKNNLYITMSQCHCDKCSFIFKYLNVICATPKQSVNGGFVSRVVNELKNKNFKLAISPEGSIKPNKWRSGYYYLAKELNCDIHIMGFDYVKHQLVYKGKYNTDTPLNELEPILQKEFQDIIPLHPENSFVKIDNKNTCVINLYYIWNNIKNSIVNILNIE